MRSLEVTLVVGFVALAASCGGTSYGEAPVSSLDGGSAGEGGSTPPSGGDAGACTAPQKRCNGDKPETCNTSGQWETATACVNQTCVSGSCQGVCAPGGTQCVGSGVQTCDASGQWGAVAGCSGGTPYCAGGACIATPPSCLGLAPTCGEAGESCCVSPLVTGGTSNRLDYPSASVWPATVSDFRLDKFEITVARFRRFVGAWVGGWRPTAGAGKHTHLHGGSGLATTVGGFEGGWDPTWNANLATTSSAWNTSLSCDTSYQTWTSATGGNDERPINCASWYEI